MTPDVVIIGSGIGGATVAAGLAPSGAKILVLEAGERLADAPENRDARAIFQRGHFRPKEDWYEADRTPFNPGNYSFVGGNSKFFGAVFARYRREDFAAQETADGVSPAWPFPYETLEPWYGAAERLFQVRGALGQDPTEPPHSSPYPHPPVPDEPAIAEVRARLLRAGMHPYALPLGIDLDRWLAKGRTGWDAHPHSDDGKMDAETAALAAALAHPNVTLRTGARVERLAAGPGGRIEAVHLAAGEVLRPRLTVLSAGAVQSAAILLASADGGLANRSGEVGRNFMNHNATAVIAWSPRFRNTSVYQKSFGFNDFYLPDGRGGPALGNVQLLGRVTAAILKGTMRRVPEPLLSGLSAHAVDFYAMSEDLPVPESRVTLDGRRIVLHWVRTNIAAHRALVARLKGVLREAGFPVVLAKAFDRRTPSHQCGTVRMGENPAAAPLDPLCRAHDHRNLFVVDASFLPTSAAVNPALTIAAQALRVADHIGAEL